MSSSKSDDIHSGRNLALNTYVLFILTIMDVHDLSREQLIELKQNYLTQLADEGSFAEVLDVDYDEPSYRDIAMADEIVPDCVIFKNYEGVCFVPDDFFCSAN